jgi:hypothetical protein
MLSSTLDRLSRRKIDIERRALVCRHRREAPIEHCFGGRDQLDDGHMTLCQFLLDRFQQRRHLHRDEKLREEPLLRGFEARKGGALRLRVQRVTADAIDDVGGLERDVEIGVDDCLSRGSGNAEERGVTGEFP